MHAARIIGFTLLVFLFAVPASADLLIQNVTVIDGTGRPPRPNATVFVQGDRIAEIRDHAITAPAGTKVVDGHGKFLIPGLIDTHIHLEGGRNAISASDPNRSTMMDLDLGRHMLHGFLYSGVTTVFDAANYDKFIFAMRDAQRSGKIVSPRIFAAGYLLTRANGYGASGGGGAVENYEQGTQLLDALFVEKPDLVKFVLAPHGVGGGAEVPTFDPVLLHRLIMYTNDHGFRATIHAVEGTTARIAIEAGINALAHPVYMTDSDEHVAPLIAAREIPVSTTLVVLHNMFQIADDPSFFNEPLFRDTLDARDLARYRDADLKRYKEGNLIAWGRQTYGYAAKHVRTLYDAGVTLALGTDRTLGAQVHQELELIASLGIPPLQALRIATLNGAIYLHAEDRIGSIEEGKLADMVLLDKDPSQDVHNARAISAVILGGKIVDRGSLDLPVNHRK